MEFRSQLSSLLQDPNQFYDNWSWQERTEFIEELQLHQSEESDLLARCCWACPTTAYILARAAPSLVNIPHQTTHFSPLAFALLNNDNWQPDLIHALLERGAHFNPHDLEKPEMRQQIAYDLLPFISTGQCSHLLSTLPKHYADLFLADILGQTAYSPLETLKDLHKLEMSSDQTLQVITHNQPWFYEDSARVRQFTEHCSTQELVLLATRKPTLYFHLHHREQELILEHLLNLVPADKNRLVATHADWFLPHPLKAKKMLEELPISYLGKALGECPQIWHHLSSERQAEVISGLTSTLAPVDFIGIIGRNPLTWHQVFPGLGQERALEGLAHPSSPFHRLYKLDPEAFQTFEQFLRHADAHQERIERFFALGPELWRLFIDHEYHQFGPNTFEHKEKEGYIEGMEATAAWLCSLEGKERTSEERLANYKLAHALLLFQLEDAPYRTEVAELEFSEDRWQRYEECARDEQLIEVCEKERKVRFLATDIEVRLKEILGEYLDAVQRAESDDEKLAAIGRRFRKLCHLHPFNEGNLRLNYLILQHNLVELGFEPSLMKDPAGVVYLGSEEALVREIKLGIERHQAQHT